MQSVTTVLTLEAVAEKPETVTHSLVLPTGEAIVFRPLQQGDEVGLADFLLSLSSQTRRFSAFSSYDLAMARALCEAINRYDKLRFIAVVGSRVVALLEFSFGLVAEDRERYRKNGIELDERTDCRFGPCIADAYQNRGVGSALLAPVLDIARRFGKRRMILWGGVLADNRRAIRYYEKNGFHLLGRFWNEDGSECRDGILTLLPEYGP